MAKTRTETVPPPRDWGLTPVQQAFVDAADPLVRAQGVLGSGITYAGAIKGLRYALGNPGSLGLVMAPSYEYLRGTIVPTFLDLLDPAEVQHWDAMSNTVLLRNQSLILFRGADHIDMLRGINLAWVWIDTAEEVEERTRQILRSRLRQHGYPHQMWTTEALIPVYIFDA